MTSQFILQVLINGLVLGSIYTLVGLGLTIILGISRIFNFAHGEFYMLGAYIIYFAVEYLHMPYFFGVIISMILMAIFGVIVEAIFFKPVRGQFHASAIISIGLTMAISTSALIVFGEEDRGVKTTFQGISNFLNVTVSIERIVVIIGAVSFLFALYFFLSKSKAGQALQAVAQDREAASVLGINVNKISSLSFGIGSMLAGVAGALVAPIFSINAFIGSSMIFKIAGIVIIGGMGSFPGAILAGYCWGIMESLSATLVGAKAELIVFSMLFLVLLIRPRGFFGRE